MSFTPVTPYVTPAWVDGAAPAVTAQRLTDIGNGIISAQTAAVEAQEAVSGYGLTVVNGALNITFEEG